MSPGEMFVVVAYKAHNNNTDYYMSKLLLAEKEVMKQLVQKGMPVQANHASDTPLFDPGCVIPHMANRNEPLPSAMLPDPIPKSRYYGGRGGPQHRKPGG